MQRKKSIDVNNNNIATMVKYGWVLRVEVQLPLTCLHLLEMEQESVLQCHQGPDLAKVKGWTHKLKY